MGFIKPVIVFVISFAKGSKMLKKIKPFGNKVFLPFSTVILASVTFIPGCNWDESLYQEFVGADGILVTCRGRCLNENSVLESECKGEGASWNANIVVDEETGNNKGTCLIQTQKTCEDIAKVVELRDPEIKLEWLPLDFQMLEIGHNTYIRFLADDPYNPDLSSDERKKLKGTYICGSFDDVSNPYPILESNPEKLQCNDTYIQKINIPIQGTSCPLSAHNCSYVNYTTKDGTTVFKNSNNPFTDQNGSSISRFVGFCSSCPPNQLKCTQECIDILHNADHCGSCNHSCASESGCDDGNCICDNGQCKHICDAPKLPCTIPDTEKPNSTKTICIDPTSYQTCGSTCENIDGKACNEGETCQKLEIGGSSQYQCVCPSNIIRTYEYTDEEGQTINRSECVDPTSAQTCGATKEQPNGIICTNGRQCESVNIDGKFEYRCTCQADWELQCYDENRIVHCLDTTEKYCGLSTCPEDLNNPPVVCNELQTCDHGQCICTNDHVLCSIDNQKKCINPLNTDTRCGAKGYCSDPDKDSPNYQGAVCSTAENRKCIDGECKCSDDGQIIECAINDEGKYINGTGYCIDITNSKTCGETCDTLEDCTLTGRKCNPQTYQCTCPEGMLFCDDQCIDPKTSGTHCGAKGRCNSQDSKSAHFIGSNCITDNKVCGKTDDGQIACISTCPDGLINCQGECVNKNKYNVNDNCTACDVDHCYTGEVDTEGKPVEFDYRKCAVFDENGQKLQVQNDTNTVDANAKNSPAYCNGCLVRPYSDDIETGTPAQCPKTMYCSNSADDTHHTCACPNGTEKCTISSTPNENLQEQKEYLCLTFSDLHMTACGTCEENWDNCNGDWTDGCETNLLDDPLHCGTCATNCMDQIQSAQTITCNKGVCAYERCLTGYGDCNDDTTDGCETPNLLTDKNNCGRCNYKCEGKYCQNALCVYDDTAEEIPSTAICEEGLHKYYYQYSIWFCYSHSHYSCAKEHPGRCWTLVE